jgi:hypothetical protein
MNGSPTEHTTIETYLARQAIRTDTAPAATRVTLQQDMSAWSEWSSNADAEDYCTVQATQKCLNEPAEALLARWKSGPQRRVVGETLSREGCPSGSVGYRAREYQVDQGESCGLRGRLLQCGWIWFSGRGGVGLGRVLLPRCPVSCITSR